MTYDLLLQPMLSSLREIAGSRVVDGADGRSSSSSEFEVGQDTHRKANKSQHHRFIARFLVNIFSQEYLRGIGGYVVDIGAGKGLLSYELSVTYGVASVAIDRRDAVRLSSMERRRMKKVTKSRERVVIC